MEVASLPLVKMQYRSFLVKKHQIGAAWVLRNHRGMVLLHSRKCFSNCVSLDDAKRQTFVWAIESMVSHKVYKVIFASDAVKLIKALERPQAWPSFSFQVSKIKPWLSRISFWKLEVEDASTNVGALRIALSVTRERRIQSYVARGPPSWLAEFFVME